MKTDPRPRRRSRRPAACSPPGLHLSALAQKGRLGGSYRRAPSIIATSMALLFLPPCVTDSGHPRRPFARPPAKSPARRFGRQGEPLRAGPARQARRHVRPVHAPAWLLCARRRGPNACNQQNGVLPTHPEWSKPSSDGCVREDYRACAIRRQRRPEPARQSSTLPEGGVSKPIDASYPMLTSSMNFAPDSPAPRWAAP
jgi:hypothetical protein